MKRRLRQAGRQTFRAMEIRNFRLYFGGQIVSVSGTWMHTLALGLLILSSELHGNGFDVGVATALQYLPILVLGTWGGVVADRVDKRKLLVVTQVASGVLALVLGLLAGLHDVTLWEIFLISALLGVVTLFTNPTRQAFVSEMVGHELLPNAVSLNSVVMNSARVIGPAVAGVLIYTSGFAACFFVNSASYVAVIIALCMMRTSEMHPAERIVRAKGQVRDGLRYAWRTPALRDPLLVMAVAGTLAFNFTTTLPLLAEYTFHGGAGTYSAFTVAMGAGAIAGGLLVAHRSRPSAGLLGVVGLAFGAMMTLVALLPTESLTLVALIAMGAFSLSFNATANATVQLTADPSMRGRVMSLYAIAFLGTTPIGAPLMGWVSDTTSPRVAILVGALATIVVSFFLARRWLGRGAFDRSVAVARIGAAGTRGTGTRGMGTRGTGTRGTGTRGTGSGPAPEIAGPGAADIVGGPWEGPAGTAGAGTAGAAAS